MSLKILSGKTGTFSPDFSAILKIAARLRWFWQSAFKNQPDL
jgi:hypothetical protein